MKRTLLIALFIAVTALAVENPMSIYQRALVQEQAAGNLKQAIALYERAAKEAGKDRTLAAKALARAAACYQKLGDPRATQVYRQIVSEYPEQRAQASSARLQLASFQRSSQRDAIPPKLASDLANVVVSLMNTYCVACHQGDRQSGNFSLDAVMTHLRTNPLNLTEDSEVLERVVTRLVSRTMPPPNRDRPDDTTYRNATSLLERLLDLNYPEPFSSSERASDTVLATRIAQLIWSSEPDEILLDAARRGRLSEPAGIDQQVKRMLADPRSERLAIDFLAGWLHIPDAAYSRPSFNSPQELDWELQQSMIRETQLFLDSQIRDDRTATEIWTANYSFLNERLARHYDVPNVSGSQYRRVTWPNNARAGILGQGSVLLLTSLYAPTAPEQPSRTSPTLRGKYILDTMIGVPPPPPPPAKKRLEDDGLNGSNTRKRVEAYTSLPQCGSCHRYFDPLGFALENFGVTGKFRAEDGGEPINASGTFVDGSPFNGPADFRNVLMKYKDAYLSNVTQALLSYSMGRVNRPRDGRTIPTRRLHAYEMPAVRAILREAAASNYRWSAIIAAVVKSQPFQMKTLVP